MLNLLRHSNRLLLEAFDPLGIVQAQAMATKEVLILCFETDGSLKLPPVG